MDKARVAEDLKSLEEAYLKFADHMLPELGNDVTNTLNEEKKHIVSEIRRLHAESKADTAPKPSYKKCPPRPSTSMYSTDQTEEEKMEE